MPIIDLYEGMGSCAVEGEILQSEVREIKRNNRPTGNTVITFDLADEQWACTCSIFSRTERLGGLAKAAVPGKRIRVQGNYEMDDYTHKFMIKLTAAELLEGKTVREDHASKKRVELHMHTKMSAMDAVSSVGDLVARAAKWGHKAIAVTDHGVAQAFPDAHKAAAKAKGSVEGFKVLYGVEGYLINDTDSAKLGLARLGREKTYVVFDIETTGFSGDTSSLYLIGTKPGLSQWDCGYLKTLPGTFPSTCETYVGYRCKAGGCLFGKSPPCGGRCNGNGRNFLEIHGDD